MSGEGAFKNILFAFILTSLFGVLILSTVIDMGNEYSLDTSNIANGSLGINEFNDSISSFDDNAKSMRERFAKGDIFSVVAGIVVEGIFGIAIDIIDIILAPFNVVTNILIDVMGVPTYVTAILFGILIFSMMFGIWRLIKIGA